MNNLLFRIANTKLGKKFVRNAIMKYIESTFGIKVSVDYDNVTLISKDDKAVLHADVTIACKESELIDCLNKED